MEKFDKISQFKKWPWWRLVNFDAPREEEQEEEEEEDAEEDGGPPCEGRGGGWSVDEVGWRQHGRRLNQRPHLLEVERAQFVACGGVDERRHRQRHRRARRSAGPVGRTRAHVPHLHVRPTTNITTTLIIN